MTEEEVKEELNSYKYDLDFIEELEKEIEEYNNKATSCTSNLTGMPGSHSVNDLTAEYATLIADIEKDKTKKKIEMEKNKNKIENKIFRLKQPFKNILYFRHIKGYYKFDALSEKLHFEKSWLMRLYKRALIQYMKLEDIENDKNRRL